VDACDPRVRVRLVSHNNGLPIVIAAIKTSAGRVRERGLDYYLNEYASRKPERAVEWLREAAEKYPSVLEHWVFTFFIDGCSRACTHQLVRHRLASYTQESQRYTIAFALSRTPREYLDRAGGESPDSRLRAFALWMEDIMGALERARNMGVGAEAVEWARSALEEFTVVPPTLTGRRLHGYLYEVARSLHRYAELVHAGVPYEDARYLLPQSMRTRILATANLRQWHHMIRLRTSRRAQWEIRCVMCKVRGLLHRHAPIF